MNSNNQVPKTSILTSLRSLVPRADRFDFEDAKVIAERQARILLERLGTLDEGTIGHLPRIRIIYETLPTSGMSYWNGRTWIIALNETDTMARQRYTLLHEFKHIVDHGEIHRLYRSQYEAERAADFFAACALMPKPELKRVFCNQKTQDLDRLAEHFGVSRQAIQVRLVQTGLLDPDLTRQRCARPVSTPTPTAPVWQRATARSSWRPQYFRTIAMPTMTHPLNRSTT